MKKFILIFLIIATAITVFGCGKPAQHVTNDDSRDDSGDNNTAVTARQVVKKRTIISYYPAENFSEKEIMLYNTLGLRSFEEIYYTLDGVENYEGNTKIEYSASGKISRVIEFDATNDKTYESIWTYDQNDNLLEKISLDNNGNQRHRYVYTTDATGGFSKVENFSSTNALVYYYICKNDSLGRCIEETLINANGTIENFWKYEYYKNTFNETKTEFYSPNGTLIYKNISQYDSRGNLIRNEIYSGNILENYYIYEYDSKDRRKKYQYFLGNGSLEWYYLIEYDDEINTLYGQYYTNAGIAEGVNWTEEKEYYTQQELSENSFSALGAGSGLSSQQKINRYENKKELEKNFKKKGVTFPQKPEHRIAY